MKRLRNDTEKIPKHPKGGAKGTACDIKYFPDSKPGKGGPFGLPPKPSIEPLPTATTPHSAGYFDAWVNYFVNVIGGALERLNGHQFNLDKRPGPRAKAMSKELSALANALSGTTSNPVKTLDWPLNGTYTFKWTKANANKIGYGSVTINVGFEKETEYEMVVNSSIEIIATAPPLAPVSSSSSYLATSSSSG